MTSTTKHLIIGGGLEGLAIAWALTARGERDVTVIERNQLCSGMTGKSSGVVRCHYGTPSIAAMSWYGVHVLGNAREILGDEVGFEQCGYVVAVAGEANERALRANVAMHQSLGIDVAVHDPRLLGELWPGIRTDDMSLIAYEPRGGRGDGPMLGMAFAGAARRAGATFRQGTAATGLLQDRTDRVYGVRLADGGEVHAENVILATNVWAPELASSVGIDLPIKAELAQLIVVDTGEPLPRVPVLSDLVALQYLCREPNGTLLAGNSDHGEPIFADPYRYPSIASESYVDATIPKVADRLPAMPDASLAGSYTGCYDVTPDYNPIIGPAPLPGLFLAAGFSGHGFKISPAVGRLVADLLLDGESSDPNIPAHDFRYSRFEESDLLVSQNPYAGAGQMR